MCGIVGGLGDPDLDAVRALDHRGPDASGVVELPGPLWLGHTRLAILDLDRRSDQPFRRGSIALTYNGELWNFRALRAELEAHGESFTTSGDTEVLAAALDRWGAAALPKLDGMFAFAWSAGDGRLHLARDRFGEVPLHVSTARPLRFASELKALRGRPAAATFDVGPGELWTISRGALGTDIEVSRWYEPPIEPLAVSRAEAALAVRRLVRQGARARAIADVPACTLLSGGVDSAAIALELKDVIPGLVAYVAVMDPASPDLRSARLVAERIGVELREVRVTAPSADDFGSVVEAIEMPHKTQVEIGWACLALARRMRADGFRVTFSGEGSDELWGAYGFAHHALKTTGWHAYRRGLVLDQARKNFARCNKVFLTHGVECRLPFLEHPLVELALALPRSVVEDPRANQLRRKMVLREAYRADLGDAVVDRGKLGFQEGLGIREQAQRGVGDPKRFYRAEYARRFG